LPAGLGVAGSGNGCQASTSIPSITGIANTGGGGGGGGNPSGGTPASLFNGAAGGSGIVIIRYPATQSAPASTTGSPQINYLDGYQIYTWTSSGTVTF
jgi:hypothetical protein